MSNRAYERRLIDSFRHFPESLKLEKQINDHLIYDEKNGVWNYKK